MKWHKIEDDGLPPCRSPKPDGLCWDIFDPEGGVRVSQMHPANWNRKFTDGDMEIVTHWMNRPKGPKEKP